MKIFSYPIEDEFCVQALRMLNPFLRQAKPHIKEVAFSAVRKVRQANKYHPTLAARSPFLTYFSRKNYSICFFLPTTVDRLGWDMME